MLAFVARRLAISIPVFLGILLLSFILVQLLPGDPMTVFLTPEELVGNPEYIELRRAELGLDQPLLVQYLAWLREIAGGNLGYSFHRRGVSVLEMIAGRGAATLKLTSVGVGIALLVGVPTGILAALRQNKPADYVSSAVSMLAISIPTFFQGLLAIFVFSLVFGWLPSGGMGPLGVEPTLGVQLQYLALPALTLASVLIGPYVRYVRQSMLEVLRQDFVTTATAKGVTRRGVVVSHVLRNALIPLTTVLAIQVPALLAGTVIIETVFTWPGMGRLVIEAIAYRDYPVIIGVIMVTAVLVMVFNLMADIAAALLDPRIRQ